MDPPEHLPTHQGGDIVRWPQTTNVWRSLKKLSRASQSCGYHGTAPTVRVTILQTLRAQPFQSRNLRLFRLVQNGLKTKLGKGKVGLSKTPAVLGSKTYSKDWEIWLVGSSFQILAFQTETWFLGGSRVGGPGSPPP